MSLARLQDKGVYGLWTHMLPSLQSLTRSDAKTHRQKTYFWQDIFFVFVPNNNANRNVNPLLA